MPGPKPENVLNSGKMDVNSFFPAFYGPGTGKITSDHGKCAIRRIWTADLAIHPIGGAIAKGTPVFRIGFTTEREGVFVGGIFPFCGFTS